MEPLSTNRRTLLKGLAAAAIVPSLGSLAACKSGDTTTAAKTTANVKKLLPTYKAGPAPTAELPGDGKVVEPGYLKYPAELTTSVPEKPGKGSTFKTSVMYFGDPQPVKSDYQTAVNEALGATMEWVNIPANDYDTKITALLAGGQNLPDLVTIPGWGPPVKMYDAYDKAFVDLTPKLSGDNVLKYPNLAAIPTSAWHAGIWGGRIAAVPTPAPTVSYVDFYRRDLFAKKSLKAPTSGDELLEVAKALTDAKSKRWAMGDPMQLVCRMHGISTIEYPWDVIDGKMTHIWETPQFTEVLAFMKKMYAAGQVHPDVIAGTADPKALFANGQVAMYSDGYDAWQGWKYKVDDTYEVGFDADGMVPFSVKGGATKVAMDGSCIFITFINKKVTGAKLDELLSIMNYLAAPFGSKEYELLNFGVEGKTFDRKDGAPVRNAAGDKQIKSNFNFTASGPRVDFDAAHPDWVKKRNTWAKAVSPMAKPLATAGIFVNMPASLASGNKKPLDAISSMMRGRQQLSEWPNVVKAWQSSYGDKVRDLYSKAVEANK